MKERIRDFLIFAVLVLIDQLTKYWVKTELIKKDIVLIPKVLRLQYHTNTGAVWGILTDQTLFLSIFTVLVLLLLILFYLKIPRGRKYLPLNIIMAVIAAGAVGNLIDRVLLGYVIDFIYFELINFPLFNFADSCLVLSCIALFILTLFYYKDEDLMFIYGIFGKSKAARKQGDKGRRDDSLSDTAENKKEAIRDENVADNENDADAAIDEYDADENADVVNYKKGTDASTNDGI